MQVRTPRYAQGQEQVQVQVQDRCRCRYRCLVAFCHAPTRMHMRIDVDAQEGRGNTSADSLTIARVCGFVDHVRSWRSIASSSKLLTLAR